MILSLLTDASFALYRARRSNRLAILARLSKGQATVNELAKPFDMSLPAISKHLKVLETAGLISRNRDAQWRPCKLESAPLKDISNWVERYRKIWDERFDRLDENLQEMKKEKSHGRNKK